MVYPKKSIGYAAALAITCNAAASLSRADVILVASPGNKVIESLSSTGIGTIFSSLVTGPEGMAVDHNGVLFASINNVIQTVSSNGTPSPYITPQTPGPEGLAFDSAGNLFFSTGKHALEKLTPQGSDTVFATLPTELNGQGVAIDSSNNVFTADQFANAIQEFSPTGVHTVFATGLNSPFGLPFDSSGNLYVSNAGNNTIDEFSPLGTLSVFAITGLNKPEGLAFDSLGNLYAVNNGNNTVERFTPAGTPSLFASNAGLITPTFITIVPNIAPEPATLPLLAIACLTLFRRRQRRRHWSLVI